MQTKNLLTLNLSNCNIPLYKDNEIFKQLPKTNYYISNYGRLLRMKKDGTVRLLKPSENENGYLGFTLGTATGKADEYTKHYYQAHRLVALMYVPCQYPDVPISDLEVHHKDGDVKNNAWYNLMWTIKGDHRVLHRIKGIGLFDDDRVDYDWFTGNEDYLAQALNMTLPQLMDKIKEEKETGEEYRLMLLDDNKVFVGFKMPKKEDKEVSEQENNKEVTENE